MNHAIIFYILEHTKLTMLNTSKTVKILTVFLFPALYALILRILFGMKSMEGLFGVMTISFLFLGPFIMGIIATYFSDEKDLKSKGYVLIFPWIPLAIFLFATLLLELEGWACWVMVFPLWMLTASLGGYIGALLKRLKSKKTYVSIAILLPFFLGPIENKIGRPQQTYRAYNYIDINASPETIWNLVTRVSHISKEEDSGWLNSFLGFPRPVEAELDKAAVGGYRKAIFTNGLVFHETVTAYEHQKKMTFSIQANPYEIPSTTLDEHVVVGGKFFNVKDGTYELEQLSNNTYRLHLYSHFTLKTTFNFYASVWAKWIMQDIQQNILHIEKQRAESKTS